MATSAAHTFQILTKRHGRMRSLLSSPAFREDVETYWADLMVQPPSRVQHLFGTWPLPNVWLGVSVEDQRWADIRIPALLDTPAAVRFLSCEPLLGPVELGSALPQPLCDACSADMEAPMCSACYRYFTTPHIDWVIAGGESGPKARPMHPDWARSLRDRCVAAGVAFFFKQWGVWVPDDVVPAADNSRTTCLIHQVPDAEHPAHRGRAFTMHRFGKKVAGRELDGRVWDEFPQARAGVGVAGG